MSNPDSSNHDAVQCAVCEEMVPRAHTVLRASLGRVCWFCHTDENVDSDREWDDDDDEDEDETDWDDWDD